MLTADYVIGIVDGEGCFSVRLNEHKNRRAKVELKFSLKLRHQDKNLLYELKQFFNCGNIYIQRDKRKNHSLCYRFEVQNKKDIIEKIIPFFKRNKPRTNSRSRDFEFFSQISKLSQKDKIDFEKIKSLKSKMHWGSLNTGKPFVKWGTNITQ